MPLNPNWTSNDVLLTLSLPEYQNPDGKLAFTSSTVRYYDNEASFTGAFTTGEIQDFILVDLKAGATYDFLASGDYQVSLSLFDTTGHMLLFTDGDEIGIPDVYPRDSILDFKPDYTGTYKLYITYTNLNTNGNYFIVGSEDNFSDGKNTIVEDTKISNAIYSVLLLQSTTPQATDTLNYLTKNIHSGVLTTDQAIKYLVDQADATTTVANLSYQFFTGKTPYVSGMVYLVSPTGSNPYNLNSSYYQGFNLENRYINFAVNLGVTGEGKTKFAADYGSLTLAEATKKAYTTIFGGTPTDAKIASLLSGGRDAYFESYGHDGLNGLGTKAAMVGWLLAEAAKSDIGVYSRASNAYLLDAAGLIQYPVDLVGVFGKPEYAYSG